MKTVRYVCWLLLLMGAICAKSQEQRLRRGRVGTEKLFERLSDRRHSSIVSLLPWCDRLLAYGMDDVIVSSDSGRTWSPLAPELPQRTAAAIELRADSLLVLSPTGAINVTTNMGLSWSRIRSSTGSQQNQIVATDTGWSSASEPDARRTARNNKESLSISDTTVIVRMPSGCSITFSDARIASASCIAGSYRHIFVGLGRSGILTIDRQERIGFITEADKLNGQFIGTLCLVNDLLYAGTSSEVSGVYRRPEYAQSWSMIPFDHLIDNVDPLCMYPTSDGVYVGMRDHGIGYISHMLTYGVSIHLGLSRAGVTSIEPFGNGILIGSTQHGPCFLPRCTDSLSSLAAGMPRCMSSTICVADSTLLIGCHDGWIYCSTDAGLRWEQLSRPVDNSEITKLQKIGSHLFLSTMHGLLRSEDGGTTWKNVHEKLTDYYINKVVATDSTLVILTTTGTLVLDARDSLHVASLPTGYELSSYVTDVHYQDGVAFAAGYPTTSISTDGGLTWKAYHSEEIMTTRLISSIGPNVYVMNVDGFLYRVRRTDLLSKIRSAP